MAFRSIVNEEHIQANIFFFFTSLGLSRTNRAIFMTVTSEWPKHHKMITHAPLQDFNNYKTSEYN